MIQITIIYYIEIITIGFIIKQMQKIFLYTCASKLGILESLESYLLQKAIFLLLLYI